MRKSKRRKLDTIPAPWAALHEKSARELLRSEDRAIARMRVAVRQAAEHFLFIPLSARNVLPSCHNFGDLLRRQAIAFNHGGIMRRKKPGGLAQSFQNGRGDRQVLDCLLRPFNSHQGGGNSGGDRKFRLK